MNISIDGRLFEWDDEKAVRNRKKHKVDFKDAALVFYDEYRIEEFDEENSIDEDRWKVTGMVGNVLVVIYTEREEATRLISARKAEPKERRQYNEHRILLSSQGLTTDSRTN